MITYIADLFSLILYGEPLGSDIPAVGELLQQLWKNLLNLLNGFGGGAADVTMNADWLAIIPVMCAWFVVLAFAFGFVRLLMRLFCLGR